MTKAGRLRQVSLAFFASMFALLGMGGVAFALGPRTPIGAAVRNVAHDVGLPVDSGRLTDARDVLLRLKDAIDAGKTDEAQRQASVLKRRLSSLDQGEQDKIAAATGLLQVALAPPGGGDVAPALVLVPPAGTLTAGPATPFAVHHALRGGVWEAVTGVVLWRAPDGTCRDTTCVATLAGPHTVTARRGPATGSAAVTV